MEQHGRADQEAYPTPHYYHTRSNSAGNDIAHYPQHRHQRSVDSVSSTASAPTIRAYSVTSPGSVPALQPGMGYPAVNGRYTIPEQFSAAYSARYPSQDSQEAGYDADGSDVSGVRDGRARSVSYPGVSAGGYGPGMAFNPLPTNQSMSPLNPMNWFKQPPAARPHPLQAAADKMSQRVVWNPRKPPNPFKRTFSPLAALIVVLFLASAGYYFYVRIAYSLDMGPQKW